jgi:ribosomal protein S18 acetylase RimI-like enzyme
VTNPAITLRSWALLSDAQRKQAQAVSITTEQLEYAGSVERQLESVAKESGPELAGLAILDNEVVAGFLVLKRGSKAPDWAAPNAAIISGMRIDQSQQGRRIGSTALLVLPSWLAEHWPACTELALSVDEENAQGIKAYAIAGFVDHGLRVQGRIGWVRYMSKHLQVKAPSAA